MQRINIHMGHLENLMLSNLSSRIKQVTETITANKVAIVQNADYLDENEKIVLHNAITVLDCLQSELIRKYDYILNL